MTSAGPQLSVRAISEALQGAAQQQGHVVGCDRAGEEPKRADQKPDLKDRPVSDEIAEPAKGQHETGIGEDVGNDDPANILKVQRKGARDTGEGDVDRGVEGRQQRAEADDEQAEMWSWWWRHCRVKPRLPLKFDARHRYPNLCAWRSGMLSFARPVAQR